MRKFLHSEKVRFITNAKRDLHAVANNMIPWIVACFLSDAWVGAGAMFAVCALVYVIGFAVEE